MIQKLTNSAKLGAVHRAFKLKIRFRRILSQISTLRGRKEGKKRFLLPREGVSGDEAPRMGDMVAGSDGGVAKGIREHGKEKGIGR